jgi:hypothetical protein
MAGEKQWSLPELLEMAAEMADDRAAGADDPYAALRLEGVAQGIREAREIVIANERLDKPMSPPGWEER